ncbi:hypothetical protein I5860_017015 [Clostridioides difficile]
MTVSGTTSQAVQTDLDSKCVS